MMLPWSIVVECIAAAAVCAAHGTPDLGANQYPTRVQCERAMVEIARNWNPGIGAYTFNCRQWPW